MKKKKSTNKSLLIIAILTIVICVCAIFTFVPMRFGNTQYTGVWGTIGVSSNVRGGVYAEYDIVGEASETQIANSMEKIKNILIEKGYQSSNVLSVDNSKIRVEIGYSGAVGQKLDNARSDLAKVASGAFEFRSAQSKTDYVAVTGKDHIKKMTVADYNGKTFITFDFNESGEKQFEKLCTASQTVYVYMGDSLQTSFSVGNLSSFAQIQLTVADYASAKDFYFRAMYGSLDVKLSSATVVSNTMSSLLGIGASEGASIVLIEFAMLIALLFVAGFVYIAIKFGIAAVLFMPIMMLNSIIACWTFAGISMFEINVASLVSISLGLSVIFGGAIFYLSRIAEEYKQGKTIDASIEAGTKKARPATLVTNILLIALFAVFAIISSGELACASIVLTLCGALNLLSNTVLLPWFVASYNKTNKQQGKPFRFAQRGGETNE